MKVLVIGSGGREHALAWKAAQGKDVEQVLVAPGNAGTAREARLRNVDIAADDLDGLLKLAGDEGVDLTLVGPEAPLAAGIVDRFTGAGLACFGPSQQAAQLESSKAYAKDFLKRYGIPTADWEAFTEVEPALDYARGLGFPVVIKADGLAAGKGVVIAEDGDHAERTLKDMLSGKAFGEAGARVVVEAFLTGEEASFIAIADGEHILPLATSQDHKRRDDGDRGPNTGGMGAYSPAPVIDDELHDRVMREIMLPTLEGMRTDGAPFTGFLYAGLMITPEGPKVLEYNARFGDPEAQPVLTRLDSDLVELCRAAVEGRLDECTPEWDERVALGVVLAAGGYPGDYEKGHPIAGLDAETPEHVKVFHAGTALRDGGIVTAGGRVLCVVALGADVAEAQREAYKAAAQIGFEGAFRRGDIGHHAIHRGRP